MMFVKALLLVLREWMFTAFQRSVTVAWNLTNLKSRVKSEITSEIMKSRVKSWNHVWNQKSRRDFWKIEISYAIVVRVGSLGAPNDHFYQSFLGQLLGNTHWLRDKLLRRRLRAGSSKLSAKSSAKWSYFMITTSTLSAQRSFFSVFFLGQLLENTHWLPLLMHDQIFLCSETSFYAIV